MHEVYNSEGSLDIPLGSKLIISYRNKKTPGPKNNHFYALFGDDDDVDF